MTPKELVDDSESIGCLEPKPLVPPEQRKKSLIYTFRFPTQDHKLEPGRVCDPTTNETADTILEIDDATGTLKLMCDPKLSGSPLPEALIPDTPYDDRPQRN